jgi:membrane-anchored protein YejM (alkaline phosphatase superfamily)
MSLLEVAVKVPMLIYQPRLLAPQHIRTFTSHVDILPTILDAMGIRYDPAQFEGESLFRPQRHVYTFFYSPKSSQLGSIDVNGKKLIANFARGSCWTIDLIRDPKETSPTPCDRGSRQLADLLTFSRFNTGLLTHLASQQAARSKFIGR